jgi:Tol biopolymer transport system component
MSIGNPYVTERPLSEDDPYVRRYDALVDVVQGVKRGRQIVLVYGAARMGKTSFLRQVSRELVSEFRLVWVELMWPEAGTPQQAFATMHSSIAEQLSEAADRPPAEARQQMEPAAGPSVTVLVDGLSLGDLRGEAGAEFVTLWQNWLASVPQMRFVVAVDGSSEGAGLFSPALASLPGIELKPFTLEETEELLVRPARGRLDYDFAAVRRIWQLTSGQPYLVQVYGYVLFSALAPSGRATVHDVEQALDAVLVAAHEIMDRMWRACSAKAQLVLALSNELLGRHGVLDVLDLRNAARRQSVELDEPDLEEALGEMLAVGVVRRLGRDSFAFSSDLFRKWLSVHKPVDQTLRELQMDKGLAVSFRARRWRPVDWGSLVWWALGAMLLGAVFTLWNMRGSAELLTASGTPTATARPFATRATLVIGPQLGNVAYIAKENPDADWEIWVMRGDGSDPQQLTDDPADDISPAWSPDGSSIAFVTDRDGNREIYVMKADGTQQINLTNHGAEDWTPAWSPDGGSIAFSSYRDGNWEIYVMGSDGSNPTRLTTSAGADYGPSWSPDSQDIAFHSNRDGNWEIYVIGRDGQRLRRLTEDEATDFAPAWSPDGTLIAFESYRDGNMEIYLMFADGSEPYNISNDPYSNEHGPSWAREGTRLLYFSNRDGGWDIFSIRPDGTEKSNLTLSPTQEQAPEWHE